MIVEARAPEKFAAAFGQLKRWRAQALPIIESWLIFTHKQVLLDAAAESRRPTVNSTKEYAEAGGLVAYCADYADRILKGAKPGELPVQQPVKFEFVIHLKSAKAMGPSFPQSVLLRADEVIQ